MRGAEIAQDVFLGVAAFLRADDHDAVFAQPGKAADHRAVLGKQPVAVQFLKIGERPVEVIQRVGPLGMPRQLDALPGGEVRENLPPGFLQLLFDELDFLLEADAERMLFRVFPQFVQLALQFDNRLFEIELMFHASGKLNVFRPVINANSCKKSERPDLRPAFVVTRFIRLHPGAQKGDAANLGSLSEPRHEQNLYANPKRTAKSFIRH